MGEDNGIPFFPMADFLQKSRYAPVLVGKRFAVGRPHVYIIAVPPLKIRVVDFVEKLHLPVSEVDFHGAWFADGIGETAIFGKSRASGERTGVRAVESDGGDTGFHRRRFFLKRGAQRYVGLSVTHSFRHIYRSMSDEIDIHKLYL
ncbi:hypothetical protein JCM6292_1231 [Bacteroides pyogenes JCM 6292]|uniref:Uncharacterized protein n=1 Tax=Bacteroides pyogenes JCM 6292 TaxID=1235809 RepID=W4P5L5_9BACE|nr:hypothetical protein JCM6292_1231 [Bacteroides pyogenes JCM 6292]